MDWDLINITNAAKMLGVHRGTIINYINRGYIKGAYKLPGKDGKSGGPYLIDRKELESFIKKCEVKVSRAVRETHER